MTRSVILSLVIAVGTTALVAGAQSRDARTAATPAGNASIAGAVESDGPTPQPIRHAVVTIASPEVSFKRTIVSDDDGRFAAADLPAGRFTIKVSKPPFIATEFGARRPGGVGTAIVLASNERRADLVLRMPRGAVVTGQVRDTFGAPAPGMQVSIVSTPRPWDLQFDVAMTVTSDDRGVFRLFGLLPGEYFVFGTPPPGAPRILTVTPAAELDAAFRELQAGRGGAAISTPMTQPSPNPRPAKTPAFGYAPVYFPGTPMAAEATKITVAPGEQRENVDFAVGLVPSAAIDGTVSGMSGGSVMLTITPADLRPRSTIGGLTSVMSPALSKRPGPDGTFRYTNVTPGKYTLMARSTSGAAPAAASTAMIGPIAPASPDAEMSWAMAQVAVTSDDVEGVVLNLQPALHVTGRVAFDVGIELRAPALDDRQTPESSPVPPAQTASISGAPASVSAVRLSLVNENSTGSSSLNGTVMGLIQVPPAQVRANGAFDFVGAMPGTYRLTAAVTGGSGWWLRSAVLRDRDLLDFPLEVGDTNLVGLVVTLSNRHTELTGVLQDAAGRPIPDYVVVAFPQDPSMWRPRARRVQMARPATDGRFFLSDLPAGPYLLAAAIDVDPSDLSDAAFLSTLAPAAIKVSLGDGEKKKQDLKIAR